MKKIWVIFAFFGILQAGEESCSQKVCSQRMWVEGECLYWWMKDSPSTVPMVETGPTVGNFSPVLGDPAYTIVLGGKKTENNGRSGFKVDAGYC